MTCEDLEMAFAVADMGLHGLSYPVETENECEKTETDETSHSVHAEAISDAICEIDVQACHNIEACENEPFLSEEDGVSFDLRLRAELNRNAIGMDTRHRCPGYLVRLIERMPEKKSEMLADLLGSPFVALRNMLGHETFLVLLDFLQSDRIAFPTRDQVQRRKHLIDVYEMSKRMTLPDIAHELHTSFAHVQKCLMLVQSERVLYETLNEPEFRDSWDFDDDDAE